MANSYKIGTTHTSHCHTSHISAKKSDKNAPFNALLSFFFQWIQRKIAYSTVKVDCLGYCNVLTKQ